MPRGSFAGLGGILCDRGGGRHGPAPRVAASGRDAGAGRISDASGRTAHAPDGAGHQPRDFPAKHPAVTAWHRSRIQGETDLHRSPRHPKEDRAMMHGLRTIRRIAPACVVFLCLWTLTPAFADEVLEWNETTMKAIAGTGQN